MITAASSAENTLNAIDGGTEGASSGARHVIVMVTSSYPRFPGDSVGTFMEPIARGIAALGHDVHVVAPWHPLIARAPEEHGVRFHFYKYAPVRSLNVFGYAQAMRADVSLRGAAYAAAPFALTQGWRRARQIARRHRATVMHGHWLVPGGITALLAAPRLPLVISLHGSDVFVAETFAPARAAARLALSRAGAVTACSDDLARRAIGIGAAPSRVEVVPYGVDVERFKPGADIRAARRAQLGLAEGVPFLVAVGRLVKKKGFEYLLGAVPAIAAPMAPVLAIAGSGDLENELRAQAARSGAGDRIRFLGNLSQEEVAEYLAAADVVVAPAIRDDAGNVDGLPNVVMEALASGAPLVTTPAGGIGAVVSHEQTALVVPERNTAALAGQISRLLADAPLRARLGSAGRALAMRDFGWDRTARRFEAAYERALVFKSRRR